MSPNCYLKLQAREKYFVDFDDLIIESINFWLKITNIKYQTFQNFTGRFEEICKNSAKRYLDDIPQGLRKNIKHPF